MDSEPTGQDPLAKASDPISSEERNWGVAAHLVGFLSAYYFLGFVGPLVVYLIKKDESPFVRANALEALNFNITVLIAAIVSAVLVIVFIGILMLVVLGIGYLVFSIQAALKARDGEVYRYPFTLRLIQ